MTLVAKIDGVTLPDGALLIGGSPNSALPGGIQGLPTAAYYGEAPQGGLVLDDPLGDLDGVVTLEGLHTFTVDETACTGKERIWSGWLTARSVERGPYKDGPGRIWNVDIIDANWLFALMVFRASSAKRPEETDIVRVEWARNSAPMSNTPIQNNGRWNVTDNPVNFGASNYVTEYPISLFNSVAGIAGKNFYAYWDHDEQELSGHYDLVGVGPTSTLAISNVIADSDSTTFYPFLDARLDRSPAWKVTGMLFGYLGGNYVYATRQATIDTMDPSEFSVNGMQRDEVYTTDRVGKETTASSLAAAMLEQRAIDQDRVTVAIRVPAAQVNLVEAGDLIDAKFTHIPGYEAGGLVPVVRRNVIPTPGRTDMYDIHLELSNSARPSGPGGGDPGEGPYDPGSGEVSVFHAYGRNRGGAGGTTQQRWDSVFTATAGNVLLLGLSIRNGHTLSTVPESNPGGASWTLLPNGFAGGGGFTDSIAWYWTTAVGGEIGFTNTPFGSAGGAWAVYELVGADDATFATALVSSSGTATASPIAGPAGDPAFISMIVAASGDSPVSYTPEAGWTELVDTQPSGDFHPHFTSIYKVTDSAEATETPESTLSASRSWHALSVIVEASAGDSNPLPPGAGMQVRNEEVDMGGDDTGTTRFPFMPGSLQVLVDNTDQTAAVIDQDPAAGTFQLAFTPTPTELVIVNYQAAVGGPGT